MKISSLGVRKVNAFPVLSKNNYATSFTGAEDKKPSKLKKAVPYIVAASGIGLGVGAGLLIANKKQKLNLARLAPEGKEALTLTIDLLPGILKLKADTIFKEELSSIAEQSSIITEYIPKSENNYILAALQHNKVVGFIYSSISNKKYEKSLTAKILFLYVLEEYRNKKIGKSFFYNSLKSICTSNTQISKVLLLVNQEWQNAKHIYESLGFKDLRIIKNFFPSLHNNFSDGIIMTANSSLFIEHNPFSA